MFKSIVLLFLFLPALALAAPAKARLRSVSRSAAVTVDAVPKPANAEIEYFRDLLARAESAPLTDFLHLWFPNDVVTNGPNYLETCVDMGKMEMIRDVNGVVEERCKPDVLFRWGSLEKLVSLRKDLRDGASWNVPVNGGKLVYVTISPVSTYSYGLVPIRFKFKKSARLENSVSDDPTTIKEYAREGLMDFMFDNGQVLESWSFGRPEHYDEIVKDLIHFTTSRTTVGYSRGSFEEPALENVFMAGVSEREAQNEANLRRNLTFMIKMILENKGEVNFAPGVKPSIPDHFATEKPTYFNEK